MKLGVSLLILGSLAEASIGKNVVEMVKSSSDRSEMALMEEWHTWKKTFKKIYDTFEVEIERMEIWLKNMLHIQTHNFNYDLGKTPFRLGMNSFGDLNSTEFKEIYNGFLHKESGRWTGIPYFDHMNSKDDLEKTVDWREKGFVTEVKDQGQCGSCWSFSATGALEGQMMKFYGKLPDLSEQNLVDCSRPEGNQGCNGGLMDAAFQYVQDVDGLDGEDTYPYEGNDDGPCRYNKANREGDDVGFVKLPEGDEKALRHALAKVGPVSVAIDASNPSFQFYKDGVYVEPNCSPENLDHGVLAVGYGKHHGTKYYLVKNSWSEAWGDGGYIKMGRDMDNQCGIASYAVYPKVSGEEMPPII